MATTLPNPLAQRADRRAFTLVELLVVVVIIAILLALLIPAIIAAVRATRNAAVTAEINTMAAALAQFKSTYNDYPPSRMYLNEAGFYPVANTTILAGAGDSDITLGQLAQRSLQYLQKFWPRAVFSTGGTIYPNALGFHDFNGNGILDVHPTLPGGGYIIQGHQCLVFFLGGIPYNTSTGFGLSGFGRNPANPFTNMIVGAPNYRGGTATTGTPSSTQPLFEFAANRLQLYTDTDPFLASFSLPNLAGSGIPGYLDSLGESPQAGQLNFYAYFSSYGGAYDPNDVNFSEPDTTTGATSIALSTNVGFPCVGPAGPVGSACVSPSPNPYSSSLTTLTNGTFRQPTVFQKPNTFQIISSGADGQYGLGGQWTPQGENNLPYDGTASSVNDSGVRQRELDNLSNFATGKLGS